MARLAAVDAAGWLIAISLFGLRDAAALSSKIGLLQRIQVRVILVVCHTHAAAALSTVPLL